LGKLAEDITGQNALFASGLAFGIDTIAHRAALKNNLPTAGVLANGLDRIYPTQNSILTKQMTEQGGLLTDFMSNTNPDKQNFPKRNRIVAVFCTGLQKKKPSKNSGHHSLHLHLKKKSLLIFYNTGKH